MRAPAAQRTIPRPPQKYAMQLSFLTALSLTFVTLVIFAFGVLIFFATDLE